MAVQINDIDRQAAEWASKADGGFLAADDRAALERWLAADVRHVGAYTKASAVLVQVERMRATGAQADYVLPRIAFIPSRRQMVLGGALAAGLAAVALTANLGWTYLQQQSFATELGESRVVALEDGSVVTLNTGTKIIVRYSHDHRNVALIRGEALFDVAKNAARPFIVTVRDVTVRDVGTSFAVRAVEDGPVHVLVREGVVELKRPATPVAAPVLLRANGHAVVPPDAPIVIAQETPDGIKRELAWKTGRIAFEDQTLAAAACEFARYSNTRIIIDDPDVASRTVTGLFVANDPVGFAKAVAASLDLDADVGQNEVRLAQKKKR